jgi:hypothetical protein
LEHLCLCTSIHLIYQLTHSNGPTDQELESGALQELTWFAFAVAGKTSLSEHLLWRQLQTSWVIMLEFYFYQYSHIWHRQYSSYYGCSRPLSFTVWEQLHLTNIHRFLIWLLTKTLKESCGTSYFAYYGS